MEHKSLIFLAAFSAFVLLSGCEQTDSGPALGISPSAVTLDVETGSVELTVGSGTTDGSLPLEWSVSNPNLGSIIRSEGMKATYARRSPNGQNSVTVKDQLGVEGIAYITQVDEAPAAAEADTDTSTTSNPDSYRQPSATPAGSQIVIRNFWNDGGTFTTPNISPDSEEFQLSVSDSQNRPGETHSLSASGITWNNGVITGFTIVVDGVSSSTYATQL